MTKQYFTVIPKGEKEPLHLDERAFEDFFKIRYLSRLEFEHWEIEQEIKKRCTRAIKRGRMGALAIWLGKLHERELSCQAVPDITICEVHKEVGYGLIANKDMHQWEFVGEYTGVVKRRPLFFPKLNDYCFAYPREWMTLKPLTIDSEMESNFTRFINHSDNPNVESVGILHEGVFHILFRTLKKIKAGEELTYNYGDLYWQDRKKIDYSFSH